MQRAAWNHPSDRDPTRKLLHQCIFTSPDEVRFVITYGYVVSGIISIGFLFDRLAKGKSLQVLTGQGWAVLYL